jgi:hypothetical protein
MDLNLTPEHRKKVQSFRGCFKIWSKELTFFSLCSMKVHPSWISMVAPISDDVNHALRGESQQHVRRSSGWSYIV